MFWSIIIIMTAIELYNSGLKNINISELVNTNFNGISIMEYVLFILAMVFITIISIIFNMIRVFYFTIIYFGIKIANKRYNKERIEKVD